MTSMIIRMVTLAAAVLILLPGSLSAQEKIELFKLAPPPEETVNQPAAAGGSTRERIFFTGKGQVDRFDGNEIVISDSLRNLARSVEFLTADGVGISQKAFVKGSWVGYRLDSEGKIVELRLLEP